MDGLSVQWPRSYPSQLHSQSTRKQQSLGQWPSPTLQRFREGDKETGVSKTNQAMSYSYSGLQVPTDQAPSPGPSGPCPHAARLWDSHPGKARETHRAGVAESRPPATVALDTWPRY